MNVPTAALDSVLAQLPSLTSPTVSHLSDKDWAAIEVIADESAVRRMIPSLRKAGARGIIEYPLNKVID